MLAYRMMLECFLFVLRKVNIVVVGANDGAINDPVYNYAIKYKNKTNILLIEPNNTLHEYLNLNYRVHPSYKVLSCAIGNEGVMTLYSLKKQYWSSYRPDFSKNWPIYRAATGITSACRQHVEAALLREGLDPVDKIDVVNVQSMGLMEAIKDCAWSPYVDVLQVDAEGYDDHVLYASSLKVVRPKMILFENEHLDSTRLSNVNSYIVGLGYKNYFIGGNCLCLHDTGFSCKLCRIIMSMYMIYRKLKGNSDKIIFHNGK